MEPRFVESRFFEFVDIDDVDEADGSVCPGLLLPGPDREGPAVRGGNRSKPKRPGFIQVRPFLHGDIDADLL